MKKYKFRATIQAGERGGAFVLFPFNVEKEFGVRGTVPVRVTVNGASDVGSLIKYGFPEHILGVSKAIRQQIGKAPGDSVDVTLWRDEAPRTVEIPDEFKQRIEEAGLLTFFETLSYTHRKEYCRWITEARKEETRQNRLAKAIEMLKKGVKTPG